MGCGSSQQVKDPVRRPPPPSQPIVGTNTARHDDFSIGPDEDIALELLARDYAPHNRKRSEDEVDVSEQFGEFIKEPIKFGDEALAVKPWIGQFKPPSALPRLSNAEPTTQLVLEYCYGYRTFDTRQNLYFTSDSRSVVYMTAAIGVVLDTQLNKQKFFGAGYAKTVKGHSDDITALAVHPQRDVIATGEVGKNPKVCIWRASDPSQTVQMFFQGRDTRAVTALGFSNDGSLLAGSDLSDDHNVRVWKWETGAVISIDKGGPDKIFGLEWSRTLESFCTVGIKHIFFWDKVGTAFKKKRGIFGAGAKAVDMTCVRYMNDGTAVTGGVDGKLYAWTGTSIKKSYQVLPEGAAIHSLAIINDVIAVGGRDDRVHVLDRNFAETRNIEVGACPRALDMHDNMILAGLRDGTILTISADDSKIVLMESHSDGEVWGLEVDNSSPNIIITTGDDNKVMVWDTQQRRCVSKGTLETVQGPERKPGFGASTLASTRPNQQARAVALNPLNGHVAVGHNDGHVTIRMGIQDLDTLVTTLTQPKEWMESIHYSPDGKYLAVGSHDNFVYIYDVARKYAMTQRLRGHSSFILALDWSVDGSSLHTNCGAYELLYWDAQTGQQIKSGATSFKDELWTNWTCKLGWPVQGIYGGIVDMTHVNAVHRSHNQRLFAVGNDFGLVELFGNPNGVGAKSAAFKAHSEHVTNVRWSPDDGFLYSTGGYDQTIMQWRVVG
jgi:WD40 repeat protein